MNVREAIELLSKQSPEAILVAYNEDDSRFVECNNIFTVGSDRDVLLKNPNTSGSTTCVCFDTIYPY